MAPLLALLHADDAAASEPAPGAEGVGDDRAVPREAIGLPDVGEDPVIAAALAARLRPRAGADRRWSSSFTPSCPSDSSSTRIRPTINAVTCNRDGGALAARLFGDEALWVPYTNPGLPLARAIVERRAAPESRARAGRHPAVTLHAEPRPHRRGRHDVRDRRPFGVAGRRRSGRRRWPARPAIAGPRRAPAAIDRARARALVDVIAPTLRGLLAGDGRTSRSSRSTTAPLAAAFTADPAGRSRRARRAADARPDRVRGFVAAPARPPLPGSPMTRWRPGWRDRLRRARGEPRVAAHRRGGPGPGALRGRRHVGPGEHRAPGLPRCAPRARGAHRLGGVRPLADDERTFIEALGGGGVPEGASAAGAPPTGRARGQGRPRDRRGPGLRARHRVGPRRPRAPTSCWPTSTRRSPRRTRGTWRRATGRAGRSRWRMNVIDEQSVADGFHATVVRATAGSTCSSRTPACFGPAA